MGGGGAPKCWGEGESEASWGGDLKFTFVQCTRVNLKLEPALQYHTSMSISKPRTISVHPAIQSILKGNLQRYLIKLLTKKHITSTAPVDLPSSADLSVDRPINHTDMADFQLANKTVHFRYRIVWLTPYQPCTRQLYLQHYLQVHRWLMDNF